MNGRVSLSVLVTLTGFSLLTTAAQPVSADVVFDDHFEGNSGGIPAGWFGDGEGSAVEEGTTVTLHDEYVIGTEADFDPNQIGATIITVQIATTTNLAHAGLIDFAQMDNHFWIKLHVADGELEVKASDQETGEEEYTVGYVAGYTGGPIQLRLVLDSETFSVSTDSPFFSSGPIAYDAIFTSFTRADLGHAAKLILQSECSPNPPPCSSAYDRITMEIEPPIPVETLTFGAIKALFRP